MAETATLTLAKALKLKNRMAGRIARLDEDLKNYNSVLAGSDRPDVARIYEERRALVAMLVELKTAINAANHSVQRVIYELGEFKSLTAILSGLNVKHGTVVEGYSGTQAQYVAGFKKWDVDRMVRQLETEIDRRQDQLDEFNHRTIISLDAAMIAAIEAVPPNSGA